MGWETRLRVYEVDGEELEGKSKPGNAMRQQLQVAAWKMKLDVSCSSLAGWLHGFC